MIEVWLHEMFVFAELEPPVTASVTEAILAPYPLYVVMVGAAVAEEMPPTAILPMPFVNWNPVAAITGACRVDESKLTGTFWKYRLVMFPFTEQTASRYTLPLLVSGICNP